MDMPSGSAMIGGDPAAAIADGRSNSGNGGGARDLERGSGSTNHGTAYGTAPEAEPTNITAPVSGVLSHPDQESVKAPVLAVVSSTFDDDVAMEQPDSAQGASGREGEFGEGASIQLHPYDESSSLGTLSTMGTSSSFSVGLSVSPPSELLVTLPGMEPNGCAGRLR
jgi:hypothetical protein